MGAPEDEYRRRRDEEHSRRACESVNAERMETQEREEVREEIREECRTAIANLRRLGWPEGELVQVKSTVQKPKGLLRRPAPVSTVDERVGWVISWAEQSVKGEFWRWRPWYLLSDGRLMLADSEPTDVDQLFPLSTLRYIRDGARLLRTSTESGTVEQAKRPTGRTR